MVRAPLNWQLVDSTVVQLQKASDDLVQLYKRISLDYEMEDSERAQMLQKLAFTAGISQQVNNNCLFSVPKYRYFFNFSIIHSRL